jgi:hypothetical protein
MGAASAVYFSRKIRVVVEYAPKIRQRRTSPAKVRYDKDGRNPTPLPVHSARLHG